MEKKARQQIVFEFLMEIARLTIEIEGLHAMGITDTEDLESERYAYEAVLGLQPAA